MTEKNKQFGFRRHRQVLLKGWTTNSLENWQTDRPGYKRFKKEKLIRKPKVSRFPLCETLRLSTPAQCDAPRAITFPIAVQ